MNSRERVLAALEHHPVDRLPLGFFAVDHDTVSRVLGRETYLRHKAKSQIALWEGRRAEVAQSWREDTIEFYRRMDLLDIIPASAMASSVLPQKNYQPERPEKIGEGTWRDRDGRIYRYSQITDDITCIADPVLEKHAFSPKEFPIPEKIEPPDESCFEVVDSVIDAFRMERFVIGPSGNEAALVLLGDSYERGLLEFALNPDAVRAAHRRALALGELEDQFYIRPGQDAVLWGADFSYNSGPMISPETFREICLPNIRQRTASVHRRNLKVIKHACGNNKLLLDYFIDAGYDCYQSIQKSAGMDMEELYRQYGKRLTLWGGVEVENLFAGTTEGVRRDVRAIFRLAAEGNGGLILGTSHSVAVGTKYDNFMAMLDETQRLNALYHN